MKFWIGLRRLIREQAYLGCVEGPEGGKIEVGKTEGGKIAGGETEGEVGQEGERGMEEGGLEETDEGERG